MFKKPLVTVYIVNHNYGKYLQQSIDSVLDQSYKNIQLIIIDNGSKDNSKNILKKLNPSLASIIFQKNKGLIAANNLAIRMSKGSFVMRLDADDWLRKDAIQIMVNEFKKENKLGLVFPNYYETDQFGNIIKQIKRHDFKKVTLMDQPAHGACTMFKKDLIEKVGFYDEEFNCQDGFDIWLKFIKKYKVQNVNSPLFFYRKHENNLTKNENKILKTRNKILIKSNKKKKFNKIIAVIPVRGPKYDKDSLAIKKINGKMIIDYSLNTLIKCKFIKKIFISSSDKDFLKLMKNKTNSKVSLIHRVEKLSKKNIDVLEVIKDLNNKLQKTKLIYDGIFKISVEGLFRDEDELNAMINYAELFNVDKVLGVRLETDNFYQHDGNTLKSLNNNSSLRLERDEIFREINHTFLIKKKALNKTRLRIGHLILNQNSAFTIKSDFDLKIAKKIIGSYR